MHSFTITISIILLQALATAKPITLQSHGVEVPQYSSGIVEPRYFCSQENDEHIPMFFSERDILNSNGIFKREVNNVSYRCIQVQFHEDVGQPKSHHSPRYLLTRAAPACGPYSSDDIGNNGMSPTFRKETHHKGSDTVTTNDDTASRGGTSPDDTSDGVSTTSRKAAHRKGAGTDTSNDGTASRVGPSTDSTRNTASPAFRTATHRKVHGAATDATGNAASTANDTSDGTGTGAANNVTTSANGASTGDGAGSANNNIINAVPAASNTSSTPAAFTSANGTAAPASNSSSPAPTFDRAPPPAANALSPDANSSADSNTSAAPADQRSAVSPHAAPSKHNGATDSTNPARVPNMGPSPPAPANGAMDRTNPPPFHYNMGPGPITNYPVNDGGETSPARPASVATNIPAGFTTPNGTPILGISPTTNGPPAPAGADMDTPVGSITTNGAPQTIPGTTPGTPSNDIAVESNSSDSTCPDGSVASGAATLDSPIMGSACAFVNNV